MLSIIPQMKSFVLIGLFIFLTIFEIICAQTTTTFNTNITTFDGNVANGSSQTPQTFINPSVNETQSTSTTSTVLTQNETNKSFENITINETQADRNSINVTDSMLELLQTTDSQQTENIHLRRAQQSVAQSAIITATTNRSELRFTPNNQFMLTTSMPRLVSVTTVPNSSETNFIRESRTNAASNPIISAQINTIDVNSTNTLFPNLILQNDTKSPINHTLGETLAANFENNTQVYNTMRQSFTTIRHTLINSATNLTSGSNPITTKMSHQSTQSTENSTPIPTVIRTEPKLLSNFVIFASNNHTTQNLNSDTSIKSSSQVDRRFTAGVTTLQDVSNKTESPISTNNTVTNLSVSLFNGTNTESITTNKIFETFNESISSALNTSESNTTESFNTTIQQNIVTTVNLSANTSSPAKDIVNTTSSYDPSIAKLSSVDEVSLTTFSKEKTSLTSKLTSPETVMSSTMKSTQNPILSQYNNTVYLPMVKDIHSISKQDMTNIATITLIAEVIDIFQWVSITDIKFRHFICKLIDPELRWCTIFKFIYISPSPLVTNNHLIINFFIHDYIEPENETTKYESVFPAPLIVDAFKKDENLTTNLEKTIGMKIVNLHTKERTIVFRADTPDSMESRANVDLYVFFTVIILICTVLLCLAIICSCARHKGNNMAQIELTNNARVRTVGLNGGIDLNSASNILRDENQQKRYTTNVINNEDCWVAPLDQIIIENEKTAKADTLNDTRL